MDAEEFFDALYSHFCVPFPCFALLDEKGQLEVEPADDDTASLVLLTDDDLVQRYQEERGSGRRLPVILLDAPCLGRFLAELPDGITHVTFDPDPRFHRRYPVEVIRDGVDHAEAEAEGF